MPVMVTNEDGEPLGFDYPEYDSDYGDDDPWYDVMDDGPDDYEDGAVDLEEERFMDEAQAEYDRVPPSEFWTGIINAPISPYLPSLGCPTPNGR